VTREGILFAGQTPDLASEASEAENRDRAGLGCLPGELLNRIKQGKARDLELDYSTSQSDRSRDSASYVDSNDVKGISGNQYVSSTSSPSEASAGPDSA
jgi:hypothetical protein